MKSGAVKYQLAWAAVNHHSVERFNMTSHCFKVRDLQDG